MKNLFQPEVLEEIKERVEKLTPNSKKNWGKMEVAQMLAHCSAALEVAVGIKSPPRIFIGRLLAPFLKKHLINDKPFKKNTPTDKSFLVIDQRNFEKEKQRMLELITQFSIGGPQHVTTHPHSFFGKLSAEEWSSGMFKHLDHHLKQFGV